MKTENIIVNLPFFPGFYESILSQSLNHAEERECEYSAEKETSQEYYPETYQPEELRLNSSDYASILFDCMDYRAAHEKMAKDYVSAFDSWAADNLGTAAGTFTFESMDSPREYNFRTDRVYATVPFAAMETLYQAIDRDNLGKLIKERHTSRSGFISFYSDDLAEWEAKEFADFDHNEMGTILSAAIIPHVQERRDLNDDVCAPIFEHDYEYVDNNCDWAKFAEKTREERAEKLAAWIEADSEEAARYVAQHHSETLAVLELALGEMDSESRSQWEATAGVVAARFYRCPFTPDMFGGVTP